MHRVRRHGRSTRGLRHVALRTCQPALTVFAVLSLVGALSCTSQPGMRTVPTAAQRPAQVGVTPTGSGRLRYVATTGNDGAAGTSSAPMRTLKHALDVLRAGDVLIVNGGVYREKLNVTVAAGTSSTPITVVAASGSRPVVQGLFWLNTPTYWRILGINVTWDSTNAKSQHMTKFTGGHNWLFADAEVWGAHSYAGVAVTGDARTFELRNLYVHDTYKSNGTNEDHLIYLNSGSGPGLVDGCLLVNSPNGRAIKVGPPEAGSATVQNVKILYNTMINNLGPSNIQLAYGTSKVTIQGNLMVHSAPRYTNITAFQLTGSGSVALGNLGWQSAGVVQKSVRGLSDGGGNVYKDPQLGGAQAHTPAAAVAAKYGCAAAHLATGEVSRCR
jgi:hypothetical protein